jgi:hypothetical protein
MGDVAGAEPVEECVDELKRAERESRPGVEPRRKACRRQSVMIESTKPMTWRKSPGEAIKPSGSGTRSHSHGKRSAVVALWCNQSEVRPQSATGIPPFIPQEITFIAVPATIASAPIRAPTTPAPSLIKRSRAGVVADVELGFMAVSPFR